MISEILKKRSNRIILSILMILMVVLSSCGFEKVEEVVDVGDEDNLKEGTTISEDGVYSSKDEVALYIYSYNKLPRNYIRKNEARELGWNSKEGNLWDVTDEKSIGGDNFGNREGNLPRAEGRQYYECDIDYDGGYRGGKRLVYSNDGLIYYTDDHYKTFELLYGDE